MSWDDDDRFIETIDDLYGDGYGLPSENGTEPPVEPYPMVRVMAGDPPTPPSLHVDRLLVADDLNVGAGLGGMGKGATFLHVALCTALGRPVFGSLAVRRTGRIVLSMPEDGQAVARMRLDALAEGIGASPSDRAILEDSIVMIPDEVTVDIVTGIKRLARTVRDAEAVLLIVDPARNHMGGRDENDNSLVTQTIDAMRRYICREHGTTVALAHHYRKPPKEANGALESTASDVAGAAAWVNSARNSLGFSKPAKGNRITITGLKANQIATGSVRHEVDLHIESAAGNDALWLSCRLVDANAGATSDALTPGRGRDLNANEYAALSALDDTHEPGKRFSYSGWLQLFGLNPNTFKSVKGRLLDAGLVSAKATGRKTNNGSPEYAYILTDDGRQTLQNGRAK